MTAKRSLIHLPVTAVFSVLGCQLALAGPGEILLAQGADRLPGGVERSQPQPNLEGVPSTGAPARALKAPAPKPAPMPADMPAAAMPSPPPPPDAGKPAGPDMTKRPPEK